MGWSFFKVVHHRWRSYTHWDGMCLRTIFKAWEFLCCNNPSSRGENTARRLIQNKGRRRRGSYHMKVLTQKSKNGTAKEWRLELQGTGRPHFYSDPPCRPQPLHRGMHCTGSLPFQDLVNDADRNHTSTTKAMKLIRI